MNTTISTSHSDAAFFRDRKAMLMYPLIMLPFVAVLFFMFGGGKGERYLAQEREAGRAGSSGFNANVPTAKSGQISNRDVDAPGYGKATAGQVLSSFTNTRSNGARSDSASSGLKAIPTSNPSSMVATTTHASSLGVGSIQPMKASSTGYQPTNRLNRRSRKGTVRQQPAYYYNAPGNTYGNATDQQLASQLRTYESIRQASSTTGLISANQTTGDAITTNRVTEDSQSANVLISDNFSATRLSESANAADAFNTAPTSGSRRQAERAILSGSSSYGSKKTIAWMIPVVVHEDQTFKSGNTVKLRLTKEISADGITIPANTILHAICQTGDDRLRMIVRSLQLNGQLIPLDLEVYDIDGIAGVNMPGLSNQVGGQMQSSAIQGLQVPGVGGLINTVASQARMSASNSVRQPTVRLKAGYNLYLKAQ
jgi:hypothetical protein